MKALFSAFLVVRTACLFFYQEDYKLVSIDFFNYGKRVDSVQYYYFHNDTAILLPYNDGKIKVNSELLKTKHFIMAAIFKHVVIKCRIETASLDYIKINAYKKGLFKTIYEIDQGLDYDEIVTPFKKSMIFKDQ